MPDNDTEVDVAWLVQERTRIQFFAVELLQFMRAKKDAIIASNKDSDCALLMVGAAFSLWRAIFLTHTDRTISGNFDAAEAFLTKVVRHNTISYFDDFKWSAWSFGYYLNNCRFRLQQIRDLYELEWDWVD